MKNQINQESQIYDIKLGINQVRIIKEIWNFFCLQEVFNKWVKYASIFCKFESNVAAKKRMNCKIICFVQNYLIDVFSFVFEDLSVAKKKQTVDKEVTESFDVRTISINQIQSIKEVILVKHGVLLKNT